MLAEVGWQKDDTRTLKFIQEIQLLVPRPGRPGPVASQQVNFLRGNTHAAFGPKAESTA